MMRAAERLVASLIRNQAVELFAPAAATAMGPDNCWRSPPLAGRRTARGRIPVHKGLPNFEIRAT
ncbi:hypothetical protein A5695_21880 [Mycobacterium sp. E1747]|nr:hypothetical protein A5695_21880 [Mycobacterium sp. E1747]